MESGSSARSAGSAPRLDPGAAASRRRCPRRGRPGAMPAGACVRGAPAAAADVPGSASEIRPESSFLPHPSARPGVVLATFPNYTPAAAGPAPPSRFPRCSCRTVRLLLLAVFWVFPGGSHPKRGGGRDSPVETLKFIAARSLVRSVTEIAARRKSQSRALAD